MRKKKHCYKSDWIPEPETDEEREIRVNNQVIEFFGEEVLKKMREEAKEAKDTRPIVKQRIYKKKKIAWNKGLTKETDKRLEGKKGPHGRAYNPEYLKKMQRNEFKAKRISESLLSEGEGEIS